MGSLIRRGVGTGILFSLCFVLVGAGPETTAKEPPKGEPVELLDERTRTSKTFANPDGSLMKSLFSTPVHFRDEEGRFEEISNKLVSSVGAGGQVWANEANSFGVSFNGDADGQFARLTLGRHQVGLSLEGAGGGLALAEGSEIRYVGAKAGVTLEYEVLADGVKETIVLQDESAPGSYRFFLDSLDLKKVRLVRYPDGSVAFTPPDQPQPAFVLAAPIVLEQGEPVPGKASMSVTRLGGRFAVDLAIDPDWLASPKRQFPLELDPTISIQTGTTDANFAYGCTPACTGVGTGGELSIGTSATNAWRAAVQFDLGELPPLGSIDAATMSLYHTGSCVLSCGATHTLDAYLLEGAWSAASTSTSLDPAASPLPSSPSINTANGPAWVSWTVTDVVEDWILEEEPNFGVLVKRSSETLNQSGPKVANSRYTEPTLAPRLDVTYTTDGVELYAPARVHSSGADLAWSRYAGEPEEFLEYQVHRSLTPHFEPSETTLVGVVADIDVVGFTDTTAAPDEQFSYRIVVKRDVAEGPTEVPSNERSVALPEDGLARIELQPSPEEGKATYIASDSGVSAGNETELLLGSEIVAPAVGYSTDDAVTHNGGFWLALDDDVAGEPGVDPDWEQAEEWEQFGNQTLVYRGDNVYRLLEGGSSAVEPPSEDWEEFIPSEWVEPAPANISTYRALVRFDEIPAEGEIDSATLSLWRPWALGGSRTVDVHQVLHEWDEASATWSARQEGIPWDALGGDVNPTPESSLSVPDGGAVPGWDRYDLTDLVQAWSDAEEQNNGVLLKAADEQVTDYWSAYTDDWSVSPTLRPKLTILYEDGSKANPPNPVLVSAPAAAATVSGTQTVSAEAADDSGLNGGVESVTFYADGDPIGSDDTAPYSVSWSTGPLEDGPHELSARAFDRAGLSTLSASVEVTTANSDPPVTNVNVAGDTTYHGQVIADEAAGYWRLNEADGQTTALDASGNDLDGTFADAAIDGGKAGATPDGDHGSYFGSLASGITVEDEGAFAFEDDFTVEAFLWTAVSERQVVAAKDGLWKVEISDDSGHEGQLEVSLKDPTQTDTYQRYYGPLVQDVPTVELEEGDWFVYAGQAWTMGASEWTTEGPYLGLWDEGESPTAQTGEYWTYDERLFVSLQDDNTFLPGSLDGAEAWDELTPFQGVVANTPEESGAYRHVAVVVDDWAPILYLDGEPQALTQVATSGETGSVQDFQIGAFFGYLDEVAVYASALPPLRIAAHDDAVETLGSAFAYSSDDVPNEGGTVIGTASLSADASDDLLVTKVEFFLDGVLIAEDTSPPFAATWNTTATQVPVWDGPHTISARAYDADEHAVDSPAVPITVNNGITTPYRATIEPQDEIPISLLYDPALGGSQAETPIELEIENTSGLSWPGGYKVAYRWVKEGSEEIVESGPQVALGSPTGNVYSPTVNVQPPALASGVQTAVYRLRFDLIDTTGNLWFAQMANPPYEQPVTIERKLKVALGLERYYPYEGEQVGAGMENIVNVASGNSILRWTPFQAPGRGLSTVVDLTYNSQEGASSSPLGPGWSLAISSPARVGSRLDDSVDGQLQLTDGDGTRHVFTESTNGTYIEPPGVHLFLRETGLSPPDPKWAATRPDGVTFYFGADGYPVYVEDRNENKIVFTYTNDAAHQLVAVTDAAGLDSPAAPNRHFDLAYYTNAEAGQLGAYPGRLKEIKDHSGSPLRFDYDQNGRLWKIVQIGGTVGSNASALVVPDRRFVFFYDGTSSRISAVWDPRNQITDFTYETVDGISRVKTRTNRTDDTTTFTYTSATETKVSMPADRQTIYETDADGLLETLRRRTLVATPPAQDEYQDTELEWDEEQRQVTKITQPTEEFTEYSYDENGYLTSQTDELGNTTELGYTYEQVDETLDVSGNWTEGRNNPHLSLLATVTEPIGVASEGVEDDYQWSFHYDDYGNVDAVTDPLENTTSATYDEQVHGQLTSTTDANEHTTTYDEYDANGFATEITDAADGVTKLEYTDDGLLRSIQDPNHAQYPQGAITSAQPAKYQTRFAYDSFHRLGLRVDPKSTQYNPGALLYTKTTYDPNDNIEIEYALSQGACCGPATTFEYDAMDRKTATTTPTRELGGSVDRRSEYTYDEAGRLATSKTPEQVAITGGATRYDYDLLDRIVTQRRTGPSSTTRYTHFCYDLAGDLRMSVSPRAELTTAPTTCTTGNYRTTYTYDLAHRRLTTTSPLGHTSSSVYDANGQVTETTDERGATRDMTYNERGELEQVDEQFRFTGSDQTVTTKYRYDAVGNLIRTISPHAAELGTHLNYTTDYEYDPLNRLTLTALPKGPSDTRAFIHRAYDTNGQLTSISLPVEDENPANVTGGEKTKTKYFDTGWIYELNDPQRPRVGYGYKWNSEGKWEKWRTPYTFDGDPNPGRRVVWTYYRDGLLQSRERQGHNLGTYTYDRDGQLTKLNETAGKATRIETAWNVFGEPTQVEQFLDNQSVRTTTYAYDLNGNLSERKDGQRLSTFAYNQADWLTTQVDYSGPTTSDTKNRKVELDYFENGLIEQRDVSRWISSAWNLVTRTNQSFYANRLLNGLTTTNGSVTLESHSLSYENDSDVYLNGNRTKDTYARRGPDTNAPCRPGDPCTATYTYDGRERLIEATDGHNGSDSYELDALGNIWEQISVRPGKPTLTVTQTYEASKNRLKTRREHKAGESANDDEIEKYWYTNLGDLACVTNDDVTGSSFDCANPGAHADDRLQLYTWDALERLTAARTLNTSGDVVVRSTTDYDGLDRAVVSRECHTQPDCQATQWWQEGRQTNLAYLGASPEVAKETITGDTHQSDFKTYSYDPAGGRIAIETDNGSATANYTYAYDTHGSVALLVDGSGDAQASYGYDAYGAEDDKLTKELKQGSTTLITPATDPLNAYRYTAKREDTGSGTTDMGARRFTADTGRFLSSDFYTGASLISGSRQIRLRPIDIPSLGAIQLAM